MLVGCGIAAAAPAQADTADDAFFVAMSAAGSGFDNVGAAKAAAHVVCPSLEKITKSFAWVVTGVVASGILCQIATTFAGQAVTNYCLKMVRSATGV